MNYTVKIKLDTFEFSVDTSMSVDLSAECIFLLDGEVGFDKKYEGSVDADTASLKDIELVKTLYSKCGFDKMINMLNGCFAVTVLDKNTKTLYAGRDRLGAKQLYYSADNGNVVLSTAFEPVFASTKKAINREGLWHFFTFQYVPEPMTIGEEVYAILLGHYAKFENGKSVVSVKYNMWKPEPVQKDAEQFRQQIRRAFYDSVDANLAGAKNPAAFLSGGLDSSILAAIAAQKYPDMTAYTIAFDVPGFSEADVAANSVKKYGIKHEIVKVTSKDFADCFETMIKNLGVPVADPSAIAVSLIGKAALGKCDVIMSGEGSDELWGGYHIYNTYGKAKTLQKLPGFVKTVLWGFFSLLPDGTKGKSLIKRGCMPLEKRFVGNTFLYTDDEKKKLMRNLSSTPSFTEITKEYFDEVKGLDEMHQMQYIDTSLWLPGDIDVVAGKSCSEIGLHCVTPFMDNAITDLARTLTRDDKLNGMQNKWVLRETFKDILTEEVTNGKKKGYPVPVRIWLSGELNDWARDIINNAKVDEYIDKKMGIELCDLCRDNPDNQLYYRKLWAILVFCKWCEVMM